MVPDRLAVHIEIRRNTRDALTRAQIALALLAGLCLATAPAGAFTILHSHQTGESTSYASLILDGSGTFYGTTYAGGSSNLGTVFKVKSDGTGFQILHSFAGRPSDGTGSQASLILDGSGNLYGTTIGGGSSDLGTVFKVNVDGTGFRLLHSFVGGASDGTVPQASLILDGSGNLYGTTLRGGSADLGTLFSVRTDGTGFQLLHSFAGAPGDGEKPYASLILDGSANLYGTTYSGGLANLGTVFTVKTDGTGFRLVHSFAGGAGDGINPRAALLLDGSGNLYGTTAIGGSAGVGTVFKVKTDGTAFQLLHSFAGGVSDGNAPHASLVLDNSGNLYGTTLGGGSANLGTIFMVRTDGMGFQLLHSFTGGTSDGNTPYASLILSSSGNLCGTTSSGGSSGVGTIFTVKTDGTGFQLLHSFIGYASDGQGPHASLILDGSGNLYGTTQSGGSANLGTIFKVRVDGTGFQLLHSFAGAPSDGGGPYASLVLDDTGNLYGTTAGGGSSGKGTVFKVKTDGTGFQLLHSFIGAPSDGESSVASVILDGSGNLYGTTAAGGSAGFGTVFTVRTDGTGFQLLHSFSGGASDGNAPYASLVLDTSGNLYGTTPGFGNGYGTIFKVRTDGTGFQVLRSFSGPDGSFPYASLVLDGSGNLYGTTSGSPDHGAVFKVRTDGTGFQLLRLFSGPDGEYPLASLILDGSGNLYGTTYSGGPAHLGTIFKVRTDGTGFRLLRSFSGPDGQDPYASLILDASGTLYGTTSAGGSAGFGTEFKLATNAGTVLAIDDIPGDERFRAEVTWATTQGVNDGQPHAGQPILAAPLGVSRGGLFWFFSADNPEMLLKVLDGCAVNGKYWVLMSAGTNVGLTTRVTDSFSGQVKTYTNPDQTPAVPVLDTSAFPCGAGLIGLPHAQERFADAQALGVKTGAHAAGAAKTPADALEKSAALAASAACVPGAATLCIDDLTGDRRFRVTVDWSTVQGGGQSGRGNAISTELLGVNRGGLFWFFSADNPEMLVKVLNGCSINGRFWVFTSAGTNVGLTTTVTDTITGTVETYMNPDVTPAAPVQDTVAFSCP